MRVICNELLDRAAKLLMLSPPTDSDIAAAVAMTELAKEMRMQSKPIENKWSGKPPPEPRKGSKGGSYGNDDC